MTATLAIAPRKGICCGPSSTLAEFGEEAQGFSREFGDSELARSSALPFPRHIRVITATPIALLTFDFLQPEPDWHWSPEKEKAFREQMARMDSEQEAREEEWRKRKTSLLPDDGGALARAWAKAGSGSSSPGTGSN